MRSAGLHAGVMRQAFPMLQGRASSFLHWGLAPRRWRCVQPRLGGGDWEERGLDGLAGPVYTSRPNPLPSRAEVATRPDAMAAKGKPVTARRKSGAVPQL